MLCCAYDSIVFWPVMRVLVLKDEILKMVVVCILVLLFLFYWIRPLANPNVDDYYPPQIYSDETYFSISIPVEIDLKDGKHSFVKIFNAYGFSGNGPSIEQVIKANIDFSPVEFDSEGDAFFMYAADREQYLIVLNEIRCIEKVSCLKKWVKKARWKLIKE